MFTRVDTTEVNGVAFRVTSSSSERSEVVEVPLLTSAIGSIDSDEVVELDAMMSCLSLL